ncbi:MAG: flagellar hook-associated protein FlgK [Firmicutes bacterium]|nr:flagellar hook-associated protein FlgK [Bacillota bacterium]
MSSFYGLEIGRRGLFVNQKALEVTLHNIANANTEGYTRQSLVLSALTPPNSSGSLSQASTIQVGGGVAIQELRQIRDTFLDAQFRRENRYLQEWTVKSDVTQYVEDIFSEPSDTGLNASLGEFYNTLQELAKYPESIEIRTLVRQEAIKLTETIQHQRSQLIQLQQQQDTSIEITVGEINDLAVNIRDLNLQIFKFEEGGENANELRDQRNLMVDELSGLVSFNYSEIDNGRFRIDINGFPLVDHSEVNLLEAVRSTPNPVDSNNLYTVVWKETQLEVPISGGAMKGYMDMRDGVTPANVGIPYFIEQLDNFAKAVVQEFNNVHQKGYSIPYGGSDSETGNAFFSFKEFQEPADWNIMNSDERNQYILDNVNAKNISLDNRILESVYNIATSSEEIDTLGWGNNLNALDLVALRSKKDIVITVGGTAIGIGNLEDFTKKVIADLAVEASHAKKMNSSQSVLAVSISKRRLSVSAVSLDEEISNMIMFQHAYSAAARMVTAIDQMLETLIQRTGVVGR